jgi:hypothetical protein
MSTKRVIPTGTMPRLHAIGAALLFSAGLSACNTIYSQPESSDETSAASAAGTPLATEVDPLLLFLESAKENEKTTISDPTTGEQLHVTAGRTYNAASGRACRRYRVAKSTDSVKDMTDLACRKDSGQWERVRPLLNLDNSRILTHQK